MRAVVWLIAIGLVLGALAPIIVTVIAGRSFIFHPTITSAEHLRMIAGRPGWSTEKLRVDDVELVGIIHPPREENSPWIVMFGGNGSPIDGNQSILELLARERDLGLAVF